MNTLIELFDSCQLENIASFLKFNPKKIIFIGFQDNDFTEKYDAIVKVVKQINPNTRAEYVTVSEYNLDKITATLDNIIKNNSNCYFDLTGGEELVLMAMGDLSTKYNVPMYQIDLENNKVIAVDDCNRLPPEHNLKLSLADSVTLNCGILENSDTRQTDSLYIQTVTKLWSIAQADNHLWNIETKALKAFEKKSCHTTNYRDFTCNLQDFVKEKNNFASLFKNLKEKGFITSSCSGNQFKYRYQNRYVRGFIEKSGSILEAYTYSLVKSLESENDNNIHSVAMQVSVRWIEDRKPSSITNEIDVAFMQGIIPVFISCKNGVVDKNSLYELDAIADRLGGKYTKKILFATDINDSVSAKNAILKRAEEMGISVINDISIQSRQLKDTLKKILNRKEIINE